MTDKILCFPANRHNNHFQGNGTDAESGSVFRGLGNTLTDQRWFGSGQGSQRFSVVAGVIVFGTNRNIPDCRVA